jgi:hypothetical protein
MLILQTDRRRQVQRADAKAFASSLGLAYFETSAKDGVGVSEALDALLAQALEASGYATGDAATRSSRRR